jgi:hypothetical protein
LVSLVTSIFRCRTTQMIPVRFPDSSYNFWRWWLACDRKFYLRARIKWSEMVIILNCTLPNRCGVRIFYPIIIGLIKNTILKGTYKTNIIIYAHSSSLWCHLYSTILYLYGVYFLIDQTSQYCCFLFVSNHRNLKINLFIVMGLNF